MYTKNWEPNGTEKKSWWVKYVFIFSTYLSIYKSAVRDSRGLYCHADDVCPFANL